MLLTVGCALRVFLAWAELPLYYPYTCSFREHPIFFKAKGVLSAQKSPKTSRVVMSYVPCACNQEHSIEENYPFAPGPA